MDGPVVALATVGATVFDEALVEGEVVSDAVLPSLVLFAVEGEVIHDVLVDVTEHHLLVRVTEDRHRYESNV